MKKTGFLKKKNRMTHLKIHEMAASLMGSAMWVLVLAVVLLVGIVGVRYAYSFGYQVFARDDRAVASRQVSVTIGSDTNALAVGKQLQKNGLIDDAYVFYAQSILFDLDIKPGTYTIDAKECSRSILEKFNQGSEEGS